MIVGVTRRMLPHLSGVSHLHVNRPLRFESKGFWNSEKAYCDDEESFSIPFQMKNNMYYHEHFNRTQTLVCFAPLIPPNSDLNSCCAL